MARPIGGDSSGKTKARKKQRLGLGKGTKYGRIGGKRYKKRYRGQGR